MTRKLILSSPLLEITISRLCQELIENQIKDVETVILGLQPRGIYFAERIAKELGKQLNQTFQVGKLDATFFRDDYRRRDTIAPNSTDISFLIENKRVILVDDVLNSGRTLLYGLSVFLNIPTKKIRTAVLVDRSHKLFPISTDYAGYTISTVSQEHISVVFDKNKEAVYLS